MTTTRQTEEKDKEGLKWSRLPFEIFRFTVFNTKVGFLPLCFTVVTVVTLHRGSRDREGLDWREGQL